MAKQKIQTSPNPQAGGEDVENNGASEEQIAASQGTNPISENPQTASETAQVVDNTQVQPQPKIDEATLKRLARYSKLYPKNKVFHITGDGQVFLEKSLNDAKTHQSTLKTGELKSYTV